MRREPTRQWYECYEQCGNPICPGIPAASSSRSHNFKDGKDWGKGKKQQQQQQQKSRTKRQNRTIIFRHNRIIPLLRLIRTVLTPPN